MTKHTKDEILNATHEQLQEMFDEDVFKEMTRRGKHAVKKALEEALEEFDNKEMTKHLIKQGKLPPRKDIDKKTSTPVYFAIFDQVHPDMHQWLDQQHIPNGYDSKRMPYYGDYYTYIEHNIFVQMDESVFNLTHEEFLYLLLNIYGDNIEKPIEKPIKQTNTLPSASKLRTIANNSHSQKESVEQKRKTDNEDKIRNEINQIITETAQRGDYQVVYGYSTAPYKMGIDCIIDELKENGFEVTAQDGGEVPSGQLHIKWSA